LNRISNYQIVAIGIRTTNLSFQSLILAPVYNGYSKPKKLINHTQI